MKTALILATLAAVAVADRTAADDLDYINTVLLPTLYDPITFFAEDCDSTTNVTIQCTDDRVTFLQLSKWGPLGEASANPFPEDFGTELDGLTEVVFSHSLIGGALPASFGLLTSLGRALLDLPSVTSVPDEFSGLTGLYYLDANLPSVTTLPAGFFTPPLETLKLSVNGILGQLPTEFGNLDSVTSLHLTASSSASPLPTEFGDLASVQDLRLQVDAVTGELPTQFGQLSTLTSLVFSSSGLDSTKVFPSEVGNISGLEYLELPAAHFSDIPAEAFTPALKTFKVSWDKLKYYPNMTYAVNLEELRMTGGAGRLNGFPVEITKFSNLHTIEFYEHAPAYDGSDPSNGALPIEVAQMTSLTTLSLGKAPWWSAHWGAMPENFIATLCENSPDLEFLRLHGTDFVNYDPAVPALAGGPSLEKSAKFNNQYEKCTKLKHLDIGKNQITGKVEGLEVMTQLTALVLDKNFFGYQERVDVEDYLVPLLTALSNLETFSMTTPEMQLTGDIASLAGLTPATVDIGGQCMHGVQATYRAGLTGGCGAAGLFANFDCTGSDATPEGCPVCTERDPANWGSFYNGAEFIGYNTPASTHCMMATCGAAFDALDATGYVNITEPDATEIEPADLYVALYEGEYGLAHIKASQIFTDMKPSGGAYYHHAGAGCGDGVLHCDDEGMPNKFVYDGESTTGPAFTYYKYDESAEEEEEGEEEEAAEPTVIEAGLLTGALPYRLGGLDCYLTEISLPNNDLEGTVPGTWAALTKLEVLDLSGNPRLTGALPEFLGSLSSLTKIDLANTGYTEEDIPESLAGIVVGIESATSAPATEDDATSAPTDVEESSDSSDSDDDAKASGASALALSALAGLVGLAVRQ